jgi:hypothetical protein
MNAEIRLWRVVLKAAFLFVSINVAFAYINPPIGKLTLYNYIIQGRLRFPYEEKHSSDLVDYSATINQDYDALFGTHIISRKKSVHEFRLILLGDSATWGFGLPAEEALSEQINRLNIQTCDGRVVRAYNLAYPFSFLTRDLLFLDKSMEYQPDMVFWLITLSTLEPKVAETQFILPHWERYRRLTNSYSLELSHFSQPIERPSFWQKTLIGQRKRIKNIALVQTYGVIWGATRIDHRESLRPDPELPGSNVSDSLDYDEKYPEDAPALFDSLLMNVLSTAYDVTGDIPIILVNEPIFVADGENRLVRYNGFYPRWVYDEYRQFIFEWAKQHDHQLLDYWNALPPEDFADAYFHRRLSGEKRFASLLAAEIEKLVCP